jgi:DNA-binding transcriptional MerR regulator
MASTGRRQTARWLRKYGGIVMAQHQAARSKTQTAAASIVIPDKLYFRIGDVSRLCALPAYVLRFWETEFPQLRPNKGGTGQRLYRRRDVEVVIEIKRLLYEEGFTIAGARRVLGEKRRHKAEPEPAKTTGKAASTPAAADVSASVTRAVAPPPRAKSPAARPGKSPADIQALRAEMRDLLAMLGSDAPAKKPIAAPEKAAAEEKRPKRTQRQSRALDEPTLF